MGVGPCLCRPGAVVLGQLCPRLFFDLPLGSEVLLSFDGGGGLTFRSNMLPDWLLVVPPPTAAARFPSAVRSAPLLQTRRRCPPCEALAPRRRNEAAKIRITALTNPQQADEAPRLEEPCHSSHAKRALRMAASGWRPDSNRQTVAAAFVWILRCLRRADGRRHGEGHCGIASCPKC